MVSDKGRFFKYTVNVIFLLPLLLKLGCDIVEKNVPVFGVLFCEFWQKYHHVINITIKTQNISSLIKVTSLPLFPNWKALFTVPVCVCFLEHHWNAIRDYVIFWAWLCSFSIMHLRFILIALCIGSSFLFVAQ